MYHGLSTIDRISFSGGILCCINGLSHLRPIYYFAHIFLFCSLHGIFSFNFLHSNGSVENKRGRIWVKWISLCGKNTLSDGEHLWTASVTTDNKMVTSVHTIFLRDPETIQLEFEIFSICFYKRVQTFSPTISYEWSHANLFFPESGVNQSDRGMFVRAFAIQTLFYK